MKYMYRFAVGMCESKADLRKLCQGHEEYLNLGEWSRRIALVILNKEKEAKNEEERKKGKKKENFMKR